MPKPLTDREAERRVARLELVVSRGQSADEMLAAEVARWRKAGTNPELVELAIQHRLRPYTDTAGRLRWIELLEEDLNL